ncbi:MAG: hypothetical protein F6K47_31540 [Symploca sp. SIO2E6]|nr:hypothetical protein [Symploca sp. SIO2E6]
MRIENWELGIENWELGIGNWRRVKEILDGISIPRVWCVPASPRLHYLQ